MLPICTKNGVSRCPRRPRDGVDDGDGFGGRHRARVTSWAEVEAATGLLVPSYLYVPKMGFLGAQEGLETALTTKKVPVMSNTVLSDPPGGYRNLIFLLC